MRNFVQTIPRVLTGTHGRRNATSSCHMHTGRTPRPAVLVTSLSCFNPTKITLPPSPPRQPLIPSRKFILYTVGPPFQVSFIGPSISILFFRSLFSTLIHRSFHLNSYPLVFPFHSRPLVLSPSPYILAQQSFLSGVCSTSPGVFCIYM